MLKNHFHLLVKIKSSEELEEKNTSKLSQPFSNVFNAYTKAINKKYNREGSLFKVRFKRNRITDMTYLMNVVTYIHLNPVKHGFTNNFKEYPFSSYNSVLSHRSTVLKRTELIEIFEDKYNFIKVHESNAYNDNFEDIE